jgi:hypothetical protein
MTPKSDYYFKGFYYWAVVRTPAISVNLPPAASPVLRDPVVLKNHIVVRGRFHKSTLCRFSPWGSRTLYSSLRSGGDILLSLDL